MSCKAEVGISVVCLDIPYAPGVDPVFWVGYLSELSAPFSMTQTGVIASIGFLAYGGLVKFEGQKFAHNAGHSILVGGGKTISYRHFFTAKLLSLSVQDDVEIQRLASSTDGFIIYQNNNGDFKILGGGKGLSVVAGDLQTEGPDQSADPTDTLTLEGYERTKPLRFAPTGVTDISAYLNARIA